MVALKSCVAPWRAASSRSSVLRARCLSTTAPIPPAFVFDIDGVLKQGEDVLPQAREALQILSGNNRKQRKFNYMMLTNGGGSKEPARAKKLAAELGVPVGVHQIVQSHTVYRALADKFGELPVLIVGGEGDSCRVVAESYGFKHAYMPADILHWAPSVWPFEPLTDRELGYIKRDVDFSQVEFAAVLVFHDSRDWGRDIQLVTDLVRAERGVFGTHKDPSDASQWTPDRQLPVFFSNPDLLWGNDFPQSRFGQGAFQESMAAVYKMTTGFELQRSTGGKPTKATYDFTSALLYHTIHARANGHAVDLHASSPPPPFGGRVYMVGDNPQSDIAGANGFGWESILVKTGVFRGTDKSQAAHVPTMLVQDVLEGVRWALEREGHGDVL